jgi:hypothetical protein
LPQSATPHRSPPSPRSSRNNQLRDEFYDSMKGLARSLRENLQLIGFLWKFTQSILFRAKLHCSTLFSENQSQQSCSTTFCPCPREELGWFSVILWCRSALIIITFANRRRCVKPGGSSSAVYGRYSGTPGVGVLGLLRGERFTKRS